MGSAARVERIPRGRGAGHDATVREVLPWHEVKARLEERGVVIDDAPPSNDDAPPPSGVQSSEKHPVVDAIEDNLTFKVYTLAELDRRLDTPMAVVRPSMGVVVEKGPSPWHRAGKAAFAVLATLKAWVVLGRGRPALGDALRAPGVVLDIELRGALKTVDWKRVGMFGGAGLATAFALLFIVLTVAELTDDLKPARTDGNTSLVASLDTPEPISATTTTIADLAPVPAVAAPAVVDELDEPAPVVVKPAPKARPSGPKSGKKPSKKAAEVFIP